MEDRIQNTNSDCVRYPQQTTDLNAEPFRGSFQQLLAENVGKPVFAIADTFNRIVWNSNGYTIGIGDTILSVLGRVK